MLFFIFIFFKISNHIFRKVLIWFYHIFRKILVWIYHIFRIFAPLKFKILTYRILKLFYYIICLINEFNIRIKNNWGNFTLEELIKKAKNGDKGAFTDLIINIQDELYKIARMRLSSEEDIDDAIQETMISAFYGIKHLKHTQYFKTWIIKILINKLARIDIIYTCFKIATKENIFSLIKHSFNLIENCVLLYYFLYLFLLDKNLF